MMCDKIAPVCHLQYEICPNIIDPSTAAAMHESCFILDRMIDRAVQIKIRELPGQKDIVLNSGHTH